MLRSIRPKRARRPFDASVDPTEARKATVRRFGRSNTEADWSEVASVDHTNVASLRRLSLHKYLQTSNLRRITLNWRNSMRKLGLRQIGFLKLVPFVDHTD